MVLKFVVMVIVFAKICAPFAEAAQGRAVFYDPPYTRAYIHINVLYVIIYRTVLSILFGSVQFWFDSVLH